MSKYIIELGEDANMVQVISVTQSGNAYIDSTVYVEYLEQLNSDYINEHFGDLQDTAYQKGFEDGVTKRIDGDTCTGCKLQGTDSNICDQCCNSYANQWTAKDDKIEVGDEVVDSSGEKGLVVSDDNKCSDTIWLLINGYRVPQSVCKEDYTKTGRHFDIDKILEEMKA